MGLRGQHEDPVERGVARERLDGGQRDVALGVRDEGQRDLARALAAQARDLGREIAEDARVVAAALRRNVKKRGSSRRGARPTSRRS